MATNSVIIIIIIVHYSLCTASIIIIMRYSLLSSGNAILPLAGKGENTIAHTKSPH